MKIKTCILIALVAVMGCKMVVNKSANDGTVIVWADPTMGGVATGSGVYAIGSKAVLTAAPNAKWKFVSWQDGVIAANRTNIVRQGIETNVAKFAPIESGTVITSANPPGSGTVSGGGTYPAGQIIELGATPSDTNWVFAHWQDGSTATPVRFVVPAGTFNVVATFTTNVQVPTVYGTIALVSEPPIGGTTAGAGTYPVNQMVTIEAYPAHNWRFAAWHDLNPSANRQVQVKPGTVTYTATFYTNAPAYGLITAVVVPPEGGTIMGGGSHPVGVPITVTAKASAPGYKFLQWENGDSNTVRTVTLPSTEEFKVTAYFSQFGSINLAAEPPQGGTVAGAGTFPTGTNVQISATANLNWTFIRWQDGNVNPVRQIMVAPGYYLMAATFASNGPPMGTIACSAEPFNGGTVVGCGTYPTGQPVTILAVPNANWRFAHWQDGSTDMARSIPLPGGTITMTATFLQYGTLTLGAEPPEGGHATGGGSYPINQTVTITAAPMAGWSFSQWQDGNTNPSRQIMVGPGNLFMVANFKR